MMKHALMTAVALTALTGCADDAWVEFKVLTQLPQGAVLAPDRIEVPEGWAIGVEAIPIESNKRVEVLLDLVVDNPGVVGIDRGLEQNHFVIYGAGRGSTSVDIHFDDELVGDMPATAVDAE